MLGRPIVLPSYNLHSQSGILLSSFNLHEKDLTYFIEGFSEETPNDEEQTYMGHAAGAALRASANRLHALIGLTLNGITILA